MTDFGPLDDDKQYLIFGSTLNALYENATTELTKAGKGYTDQLPFNYQESYWNGYSFAVGIIRETLKSQGKNNDD